MKKPSLTTQAIIALLASVGSYVAIKDPSKDRKPDGKLKAPRDRLFIEREQHLLPELKFKVRRILPVITFAQSIYLFYLSRKPNLVNFPTHYALPFYLLSILGSSWRYWCFRTLDRFFTFRLQISEGQRIVQNGPYRYLAHPSYLGQYVNVIGLAGATVGPFNVLLNLVSLTPVFSVPSLFGNPITISRRALVQVLLCLPAYGSLHHSYHLQATRIIDEEKMLGEHFGQEYVEFLSKRWRVIPFIY